MRNVLFIILLALTTDIIAQNGGSCIDFTNLSSSEVTCKYGFFSNPDLYTGVQNGRHTVMTDKTATDANTNNKLKVIPDSEEYSVRLGNDYTNAQAESITYKYKVDTNENDLLILKYAAVMEDPDHSAAEQPRFTFSILNSSMQLIDECYFANFVASSDLGWNKVESGIWWWYSKVLWKDWTTIGVDLSDFHNQTVYIKLTTYDCDQGGHFGYAYFTLNCGKKAILTEECGATVENTFTAPDGFAYSWYKSDNPTNVLSSEQSLHVTQQGEYICKCSFVGSPECYFLMSAYAGERYPYAQFDYQFENTENCSTKIQFTNTSTVTSDSTHLNSANQKCDSFLWDFGDGSVSEEENPVHTYNINDYKSEYEVTLIAYLSGGKCSDTIVKTIQSHPCQIDTLNIGICPYDSLIFNDTMVLKNVGTYQVDSFEYRKIIKLTHFKVYDTTIKAEICNGETYTQNGFDVSTAGSYTDSLKSVDNCDSIVHLSLTVNPTYDTTFYDTICDGETYNKYNFSETQSGSYIQQLQTKKGCDSIIRLELYVNEVYDTLIYDTICDGEIYDNYNFNTKIAGSYTQNLKTIQGCDSIIRLDLTVNSVYENVIDAEICDKETYSLYNFNESKAGNYIQQLQTINGCDSVVKLNLSVNEIYDTLIYDTICEGEIYNKYNFNETQAGSYIQELKTIKNCDSIIKLELFVNEVYDTLIYAAICDGDTYNLYNFNENSAGKYIQELQTIHGCDSIVNLELSVNPTYEEKFDADICEGETYSENNFKESVQGEYIQELQSINGCDSIVYLNLTVHSVYDTIIRGDICDGETYSANNFTADKEGFYTDSLHSVYGCDSVIHLDLKVHPNFFDTVRATICSNEIYMEYNFNANETGIYDNYYQSEWGCDSVITLDLFVFKAYEDTIWATVAYGKVYERNGFYETESGTYSQNNISINGCDSNLILILNVEEEPIIYIPNAITPTDNNNNSFVIYYDEQEINPTLLVIYDRWGGKVFETKDLTKQWHGEYKGAYVQTGVYKYDLFYTKINNPNKVYRKSGEVMVYY